MRLLARESVRFNPRWPEDWTVWALRLALLAAGVYAIVYPVGLLYTTKTPLLVTVFAAIVSALVVSSVETHRPRTMRLVELSVLVAFTVHVSGHVFGFYHAIPWYDTFLHTLAGFAAGMCAYGLSQATEWFWHWRKITPFQTFYLVLSFVAVMVVATEAVEFASDRHLGTTEQKDPVQDPLTDTMIDINVGMAGGIGASTLATLFTLWNRGVNRPDVAEEPKGPAAARRPDGQPLR